MAQPNVSVRRADKESFPADKYAVVDPLEVFTEPEWNYIVFNLMGKESSVVVEHQFGSGGLAFVWAAKYGDGSYPLYHDTGAEKRYRGCVHTHNGTLCIISMKTLTEMGLTSCVSYSAEKSVPYVFKGGDVRHDDSVVITSYEVGDEYQTQPWPNDS